MTNFGEIFLPKRSGIAATVRIRGMNEREREDFEGLVRRLRDHREELTPLELDTIKTRAKARATSRRKGSDLRSRTIVALATLGLMVSGTGAVIAAGPGKSLERPPESAAGNQYKGYGPCNQGSGKTGPPGRPGSNCQTDPPPPGK